ncbi:MAG: hypothetical protein IPG59_02420 [Candidatus Melainabacteria bacterium]|nr:MAG: hypothetical protein IPG59_02420 [Candidatus Melainabacteria bacterium]
MKVLIVFAVSLVVFGLSLSSSFPGFSLSSWGVYISGAYLVLNALVSVCLFISLMVVNWKNKAGANSIAAVTVTWFDSVAFVALMMFSLIVPVMTIAFEATTHACSHILLDFIPTPWHIMVLALGPVLNGFCAGLLFQKVDIEPKTVNFLNGLALGIALPFAIATVPLMILGGLALIMGMAWMVFSAVLAFIATLKLFDLLTVYYPILKGHGKLRIAGLLSGIALLLLAQMPIWLTNFCAIQVAKDPNNTAAIHIIKLFGDKHYLLRKCYLSGNMPSINETGLPFIDTNNVRVVFKKVTGKEYTSFPKPKSVEQEEARVLVD